MVYRRKKRPPFQTGIGRLFGIKVNLQCWVKVKRLEKNREGLMIFWLDGKVGQVCLKLEGDRIRSILGNHFRFIWFE